MRAPDSSPEKDHTIAVEAGNWLARRDRGLSAAAQDTFLQWLSEDKRHREVLADLERTWSTLDSLAGWQPGHGTPPNPDLLAPIQPRQSRLFRLALGAAGLAAALAIVGAFAFLRQASPESGALAQTAQGLRVIPGPERQVLEDGSVAECRHGSQIEVVFTQSERRVRLLSGELHVTVTKNPQRPFIVEANGIAVRAVGTAFAVRRGSGAVDVLVTEGRVRLDSQLGNHQSEAPQTGPVAVNAGQWARIDTTSVSAPPVINPMSPADFERELAWQSVQLEFEALPLATVVAEFNLRNRQQLIIGDPAAGRVSVAGTFRADRVDAFVRLLEASFSISVERRASGPWILRKSDPIR